MAMNSILSNTKQLSTADGLTTINVVLSEAHPCQKCHWSLPIIAQGGRAHALFYETDQG